MTQRRTDELTRSMTDALRTTFGTRGRRLQTIDRRLDAFELGRRLARDRAKLAGADAQMRELVRSQTHRLAARLGPIHGRLQSLDPKAVLARGYAICWNDDGTRAIRDAADLSKGDTVHVTLSRGAIAAKVSEIE